jgi:AcrR family transcriptional regulator
VRTKTDHYANKMLDAAARLFSTKRFHEVRIDDIAATARVSKGTVYRYFRDKEEMYLALLARASQELITVLRTQVGRARGPRQKLIALIQAVLSFFDAQPHLFDLIQRAEVLRGPDTAFPWQPVRDEGIRLVSSIFHDGRRQGAFTIRDPEPAALMLLGGMRAVVRYGKQPRPPRLAERLVDGFLDGVARAAPKRARP